MFRTLVIGLCISVFSCVCDAQQIRFDFTGTVTTSFNNGLDDPDEILGLTVMDGDAVSGFFTIDTSVPATLSLEGAESGLAEGYVQSSVQQFQFTLASGLFSSDGEFGSSVGNDFANIPGPVVDLFGISDGTSPDATETSGVGDVFLLNGEPEAGRIALSFFGAFGDTSVFDSTNLPTSLELSDFSFPGGSISAERPSGLANPKFFSVNFSIDSITATPLLGLPTILGDVNKDGAVDFSDIGPFIAVLQAGTFQAEADCNEDGAIDFGDIPFFIGILQLQ